MKRQLILVWLLLLPLFSFSQEIPLSTFLTFKHVTWRIVKSYIISQGYKEDIRKQYTLVDGKMVETKKPSDFIDYVGYKANFNISRSTDLNNEMWMFSYSNDKDDYYEKAVASLLNSSYKITEVKQIDGAKVETYTRLHKSSLFPDGNGGEYVEITIRNHDGSLQYKYNYFFRFSDL